MSDDEKFLEDLRRKSDAFQEKWRREHEACVPAVTQEDLAERERKNQEKLAGRIQNKFPDWEVGESAFLKPNGDLHVDYFLNGGSGGQAGGAMVFQPNNPHYQELWKRHGMDNPKGLVHLIIQKTDELTNQLVDIADEWT